MKYHSFNLYASLLSLGNTL